ncbi:MAG: chemotaxis protein CheW [Paludisphaera borealis]|uniref:chemotaxis protein CheW n=1 Tax=Paludisphaera borealis TaxID=1387353 RepID=UPI0028437416|nr:chemotaxis protein CheW [Paludisphaera borealis]MDR3622599.1 chemotaxis protein CheW [Paludisphaera borealis]
MLLLTFQAAGQLYAVDAARIVEVVPRVNLRPMPHAPAFLAGVFEYRGDVVSVVDLGVLLGADPSPDRLNTRIILVDRAAPASKEVADDCDAEASSGPSSHASKPRRRSLLGLIAEQVSDLSSVDPEALIASPVQLPRAPYLGRLAETEHGMAQLITVEKVLEESLAG